MDDQNQAHPVTAAGAESGSPAQDDAISRSRRDALAKLGVFAAFTLPAVSTLLISNKASAVSVVVGPGGVCVGNHNSCP